MHIEKYTMKDAWAILNHNEMSKARQERDNVDSSLTPLNYNLSPFNGWESLKEVITSPKVRIQKRKDINVLCSCCPTAPQNLPKEREREFFELAYKFLSERYTGVPVSAWVHLDEPKARAHLHFTWVCLVQDKKRNILKVCAKEQLTRSDLATLHNDFKDFIDKEMRLNLDILNGATSKGNLSILELKQKSLKNDIHLLEKAKRRIQTELERCISR